MKHSKQALSRLDFEFPEDASSDNEAAQWVNEVVEEQGSKIDKDASDKLVQLKGRNLEWLFRLVNQPWRIKRIFISFPIFPLFVYFKSIQTLPENS